MTIDTIRQMLVRYYEGNATISETAILNPRWLAFPLTNVFYFAGGIILM